MKIEKSQQVESAKFWKGHLQNLEKVGVEESILSFMSFATDADRISFDMGDIRYGELGQWDMYFMLMEYGIRDNKELSVLTGLSIEKILQEDNDEIERIKYGATLRSLPESDRKFYKWMESASSEELDSMIDRLESKL